MEAIEDIIEKDEDLKATESRIVELRQKKDRTPEEETEFKELRQHHRGRVEEQILSERERASAQQERAAKAEQALEDARRRLEEIEEGKKQQTSTGSENESMMINGKKFYTDEAISLRVQKGLMTQKEGWAMQREAIKEEAKFEMQGGDQKREQDRIRGESLEFVKKEGYGWMLDAKDPKHNSNDPLYKEANRLWEDGLKFDPDGPRKALVYAKRLLGKDVQREDRSEDLGVPKNNASNESNASKEKRIVLSDIESQNAIRYWVDGNVKNPKTGKNYTEQEALAKAIEAKRKRTLR